MLSRQPLPESPLLYTRQADEAKKWDLNFKIISQEGTTFYTARILLHPFPYYRSLLASGMQEDYKNEITFDLSTSSLDLYLSLLLTKVARGKPSPHEMVEVLSLADQHGINSIIEYLIPEVVKKRVISADEFFRLNKIYHLGSLIKMADLLHLDGLVSCLNHLKFTEVGFFFHLALKRLFLVRYDRNIQDKDLFLSPGEYQEIILTCHDCFPDQAMQWRRMALQACRDEFPNTNKTEHRDFKEKSANLCLINQDRITDFRPSLIAVLDLIVDHQESNTN